MNWSPSPSNSFRYGGCTLTGALSVTTQVTDAVTVIHGPAGCTHHNFSLLHATLLENESLPIPRLISSGLDENDIIFGGECALEKTLEHALGMHPAPRSVFVLSTCITETIGDDTGSICAKEWGVPVFYIPTAGFLGGGFPAGEIQALLKAGDLAEPMPASDGSVNLIGEKNLEFEVEENYQEIERILASLGLELNLRFVRNCRTRDLRDLSAGALNILREPCLGVVGEKFRDRLGTPFVSSFPGGLEGTLCFIREVGAACGVDTGAAVSDEIAIQEEIISEFEDIRGTGIWFSADIPMPGTDPSAAFITSEIAGLLDLSMKRDGVLLPPPLPAPVGSGGLRRMLHRWRRLIHA